MECTDPSLVDVVLTTDDDSMTYSCRNALQNVVGKKFVRFYTDFIHRRMGHAGAIISGGKVRYVLIK